MAQSCGCSAVLITALAVLAGCGEVAFKRGSGADAFAADRASCRAQNPDPAAIHACLSQKGWHVAELDSDTGPAAPTPAMSSKAVETPAPQTAQLSSGGQPAPVAPVPPPTPAAAVTPSGKISVGSWWKFGSGAANLNDDVTACVAVLGPANQPDTGYHLVTRALYKCLAAHGWHGIGHPG
jgi:hypothetical protein